MSCYQGNFTGSTMRDANLTSIILIQAKMDNVNLTGSTIEMARLTVGSHLNWIAQSTTGMPASLSSDLKIVDHSLVVRLNGEGSGILLNAGSMYVKGFVLEPGANLQGADLRYANLSGLDLRGIDFSGARLDWVLFSGSNLSGANFNNASISNVTMDGASLVGATLRNAWCGGSSTFIAADLSASNLTSLSCDGANFTRANFTNANLTSSWLLNTQFINVVLTNAVLDNCYLGAVSWQNVTSSGITGTPQHLPSGVTLSGGALHN